MKIQKIIVALLLLLFLVATATLIWIQFGGNEHMPAPVSNFSGIPVSGNTPLPVQFTDASTNTPTGWAWYFGDEKYNGTWVEQTINGGPSGRYGKHAVSLPDGSIVSILKIPIDPDFLTDVYRSVDNGVNWNLQTSDTGTHINSPAFVALSDGSILMVGGSDCADPYPLLNCVWKSSDKGVTWVKIKNDDNNGFSKRSSTTCVQLSDGTIIMISGYDNVGRLHDAWKSTDGGVTWTLQASNPGWSRRNGMSLVVTSEDTILLFGGSDVISGSEVLYNDIWKSNDQGVTWTRVLENAPFWNFTIPDMSKLDRLYDTALLPNGNIIIYNSYYWYDLLDQDPWFEEYFTHKTWVSGDNGINWSETPLIKLPWISYPCLVTIPDGSVIEVCGHGSTYPYARNYVWRLETAGSYLQNPSHTYTTSDKYSVTLQEYDSTGFITNIKEDYITVNISNTKNPIISLNQHQMGLGISTNGGVIPWGT